MGLTEVRVKDGGSECMIVLLLAAVQALHSLEYCELQLLDDDC